MTSLSCPASVERVSAGTVIRRDRTWRFDLAAGVLVLLLVLVYFTGVVASDDLGYFNLAHVLSEGRLPTDIATNHLLARVTVWKSVQLAVALLPPWPWAMAVPSLLSNVGLLAIVGALARRHVDRKAASIAILAFGLVPIVIVLASLALPEMPATFLGWLAILLAAPGLLHRGSGRAALVCLVAGALIGAGYNAKETVVLFAPGLFLFVVLFRTRCAWAWLRLAWVAFGVALWLGFETILLWRMTGDPLFHLHIVSNSQRAYYGPQNAPPLEAILSACTQYLRWLADPRSPLGPMGIVLLAGLVHALVRQRSCFSKLMICVVMPPLIYLGAGSTDLQNYHPVVPAPRYLAPMLPGMALLAAAMVWEWWQRGGRIRPALAVLGVALLIVSLSAPNRWAGRMHHAPTFRAGFDLVRGNLGRFEPGDRLLTAGLACNRFYHLPKWLDGPKVEMIWPEGPTTPDEWVERYAGAYVIATRTDRQGPQRTKHDHLTLRGASYAALTRFERVDVREPDRDRLSALWARLTGSMPPTDPDHAVELWRVPTRESWIGQRTAMARSTASR